MTTITNTRAKKTALPTKRWHPRLITRAELSVLDGSCNACGRMNDGRVKHHRELMSEESICDNCVLNDPRIGVSE